MSSERKSSIAQRIRVFTVLGALIGVYTNLSANIGPSRLFAAPTVAAGLLLLMMRPSSIRAGLIAAAGIGVLSMATALGAPNFPSGLSARIVSVGSVTLAVLAAYGVAQELRRWSPDSLRRIAALTAVTVCTLAILERYGPLGPLSDAFRHWAYGSEELFLYESDARDLRLHGAVRPNVFTQEPSHPAKFVGVMVSVWFLCSRGQYRWAGPCITLAIAAFVMRSPSLVLGVLVLAYAIIVHGDRPMSWARRSGRSLIAASAILLLLSAPFWISALPFTRASSIGTHAEADASSIMRTIAPSTIAGEIIYEHPIFGVGFGGDKLARPLALEVYSDYAAVDIGAIRRGDIGIWSNALFQALTYYGLLGLAGLIAWLKLTARIFRLGDLSGYFLAFVTVFSVEGTFPIVRPWLYFFTIAVALRHATAMLGGQRIQSSSGGKSQDGGAASLTPTSPVSR